MALESYTAERAGRVAPEARSDLEAQPSSLVYDEGEMVSLARSAAETFVMRRRVIGPPETPRSSLIKRPAACFVCIKTLGRELRGCIGTVEPEKNTLGEEVIANAIKAATRDPRFRPVSGDELRSLRYTVDVLGSLEPAVFEDLDPSVYGLVVTDQWGSRRGLLLPAIDSIRTATQQISAAAGKAGLKPDEPLKLYRFRTHRFSEQR